MWIICSLTGSLVAESQVLIYSASVTMEIVIWRLQKLGA